MSQTEKHLFNFFQVLVPGPPITHPAQSLEGKSVIHQGEVPPPREKIKVATHGCVHVEHPIIECLYEWTEVRRTMVVISGRRTQD